MAELAEIVFDCDRPAALARFWAGALAGYAVRAYDAAEIARLAARGLTPETDPSVAVDGPGPTFWFQQRRPGRTGPGALHLDLRGGPRAAEIARLQALGAVLAEEHARYAVLTDPEGNRFCLQDPR